MSGGGSAKTRPDVKDQYGTIKGSNRPGTTGLVQATSNYRSNNMCSRLLVQITFGCL